MKNSDDSLSSRLQRWRVTPPADPDFRGRVWSRIGRAADASWPGYLRAHAAAWSLAAVLAIGTAAFTGHVAASARVRADRETMVVSYLTDLDPRVQAVLKPGAP